MSPAPGSTVSVVDSVPSRAAPTDTSPWFVAGITEKGPITPTEIDSLTDLVDTFGDRVSYSVLYDAIQAYFEEGGSKAFISRAVGPTPVLATHSFSDSTPAVSLIVKAKSYGAWGNGLSIAISHPDGTHYVIAISLNGTLVETSPSFTTLQAAVDWAATSPYVDITLGVGTGTPVAVTASLTGGDDNHSAVTDADYTIALARFTPDLGPGQVSLPGRTTTTAYGNLLAHAKANNRRAILDGADTSDPAVLIAAATALQSTDGGEDAALYAPWAVIPGLTPGTERDVPYSAIQAGIEARNDNAGVTPNQPAAGIGIVQTGMGAGVARYAIDLTQNAWVDSDRSNLNDAGVNVARVIQGQVVTYGNRTLANPSAHPDLLQVGNSRLIMAIVALGGVVGDRYVFAQVDGKGFKLADFAADLEAEALAPFYTEGSLYGKTAPEAYHVDVSSSVNPSAQLQAGLLKAMLYVRLSPAAERVAIEIVRKAITEVI